ncbi:MAG: hypothetical protein LDL56_00540 [Armatimonadetes bacterium]|nr:hypothetical protein [Armatimonadota bacterium]MCA1995697.1 hypothetical protein [Armatimonadota bacterium]
MTQTPFSRDRMNTTDPVLIGRAAFHVVDAMQRHPAEAQVLGMALAFMATCARFSIQPGDAFEVVTRLYSEQGKPPEVLALEDYIATEVN